MVIHPSSRPEPETIFRTDSKEHMPLIVMSPDCDLLWDFQARFPDEDSRRRLVSPEQLIIADSRAIISHVLLASAYREGEIRNRIPGSDVWKRILQNQDFRYHRLTASIEEEGQPGLVKEDLYVDFKQPISLPTESLYAGISTDGVKRLAVIPDVYIHDLIHRYYGYLSRVAVPE